MSNKFFSVENLLNVLGIEPKKAEHILTPVVALKEDDFASRIFTEAGLRAYFKEANIQIMGVLGTPDPSAPVSVITRFGNRGISFDTKGTYMQLSFLPGERAQVALVNLDNKTGEPVGDKVFPSNMFNLKVFSSEFTEEQFGDMDQLFDSFRSLWTGTYRKVGNKQQMVYKGTDLVVFYQGGEERVEMTEGGQVKLDNYGKPITYVAVTAIAVVNIRPKTAYQGLGWSTEINNDWTNGKAVVRNPEPGQGTASAAQEAAKEMPELGFGETPVVEF